MVRKQGINLFSASLLGKLSFMGLGVVLLFAMFSFIYWHLSVEPMISDEVSLIVEKIVSVQAEGISDILQSCTKVTHDIELTNELTSELDRILLLSDSTGTQFVEGLEIDLDYVSIKHCNLEKKNIIRGNIHCASCMMTEVPIYS
ncbi:MAG: hypothetical protein OEM02_13280, partial [Desulfobulbaceae bacterium]|nr:hypothetical protein [Desulfobulbaceae bacterium]